MSVGKDDYWQRVHDEVNELCTKLLASERGEVLEELVEAAHPLLDVVRGGTMRPHEQHRLRNAIEAAKNALS